MASMRLAEASRRAVRYCAGMSVGPVHFKNKTPAYSLIGRYRQLQEVSAPPRLANLSG